MPPLVALFLTFALIVYALILDRRRNPEVTAAVWIPLLWISLIGTRFASQWLGSGGGMHSAAGYLEGSVLDQVVFLALYVCAVLVLIRRQVSVAVFVSNNIWLVLFLLYCLTSVLWSDYAWTALKRWIKVTEHVAMVLVIFTEPNVKQAIDALIRRFSYFSLALSVCFIKYFPELSRGFDEWTGEAFNMGITSDKNALGHICFIATIFLVASLVRSNRGKGDRRICYLDVLMVVFAGWLLNIADAKTALVCTLLGISLILIITKTQLGKHPRRVFVWMLVVLALVGVLDAGFDLKDRVIEALGRDATLTDRTLVWEDVLATENNPVIGTGFESFWLGERADALWAKYWWRPNQSHNGYIETYINLGALGLFFLFGSVMASFAKSLKSFFTDPFFGPLRYAYLVGILLFNYTDATFKAVHILFFLFFLITVDYPRSAQKAKRRAKVRRGGEVTLVQGRCDTHIPPPDQGSYMRSIGKRLPSH
jgi:O-antigen ligase